MLYTRFIVALSLLVAVCNGQTTVNLKNVTVTWQNVGTRTVFNVSSPLSGISSVNNAWLGIGLGTTTGMTGMNAVICRYGPSGTSVKNNLNTAVFSAPMDSTRPQLGLSDTSVFISQNNFVCNFARDNANSLQGYLTVSPSVNLYILMAYGTGDLGFHFKNEGETASPVAFPVSATSAPTTTQAQTTQGATQSTTTQTSQSSSSTGSAATSASTVSTSALPTTTMTTATTTSLIDQNVITGYLQKLWNWFVCLFKPNY